VRGRLLGALIAAATALLLVPAGALAASGVTSPTPLSPFTPTAPQAVPTASTPSTVTTVAGTSTSAGGVSSGAALAIALGALLLLAGIGYFIWRDARRRAPVRAATAGAGMGPSKPGSKRPPKPRKLSQAERRRRKRGRAR
jgi:hypothetical protein